MDGAQTRGTGNTVHNACRSCPPIPALAKLGRGTQIHPSTNMVVNTSPGHPPTVLAYVDTVHVLVIMTACLILIGYLMKRPRFRTKPTEPIE